MTPSSAVSEPIVDVTDLSVDFPAGDRAGALNVHTVLRGVSFRIDHGDRQALVGESGCGKTMTALALLDLLPTSARPRGTVRIEGRLLDQMTAIELQRVRGGIIGLAAQEPATALNPVLTVGSQLVETILSHRAMAHTEARRLATALLSRMRLEGVESIAAAYPHQLSGGQLQRVGLAFAVAGDPRLLVVDEPTSAVDPETRANIASTLLDEVEQSARALLVLGHDLELVRILTRRTLVMLAGEILEAGPTEGVLSRPRHPYTASLIDAERALKSAAGTAGQLASPTSPSGTAGCSFAHDCDLAEPVCQRQRPQLEATSSGWLVRCPFWQRCGGSDGTP